MASDLPTHSRVLGGTEENWTRSTAGGTGIVAFGIALKRAVDIQHISTAARELVERHAFLGAQIVENAKGKFCLQSCSSPPAPAVQENPWPAATEDLGHSGVIIFPGDHEDKSLSLALHKLVKEELNINFLNPEGKTSPPLDIFQVHVYCNPSRPQTVIVLKMHSGALDRQSGCVVAQDFLTLLNALVGGRSPQLPECKLNESVPATLEELIPKGKASKGFLQKGVDAVGYAVNSKKYSLLPFQPSFTGSRQAPFQSDIINISLGRHGTASLFAACKQENTTYAAALSAAFLKTAAGIKELKDKKLDEFSYTCVLDCRSCLEPKLDESALGNFSSGIPQNEKVKDGVAFWDFARQIAASIEKDVGKAKQFSEMAVLGMLFSQVMKHPNLTPNSSLRTALFTLFVDGPMKAQWKNVEALQLLGTLGPFSSMHFVGPCFCVGEALLDGPELCLSFIYPSPLYTRAQIHSFAASALELLNASTRDY